MEVNLLVIHCSATRPSQKIGSEEIRQMHVGGNNWRDIGYHYVITREGFVDPGRDLDGDGDVEDEVGAHARGFNNNSLSICLIGGVEEEDGKTPECNFTRAQWRTLEMLVERIRDDHGLKPSQVVGHNELPNVNKACPSFSVKAWMGR